MKPTPGRMLRREISRSRKFAALSPEAAVLFCMLIPHFNSWGKLNGEPHFIKGEVCPRVPYLIVEEIPALLTEISEKTNVKYFEHDGLMYLHSLKFLQEHQDLRQDRMGVDHLPSWPGAVPEKSGTSPGQVPPKVREGKVIEDKEKVGGVSTADGDPWEDPEPRPSDGAGSGSPLAEIQEAFRSAGITFKGLDLEPLVGLARRGISIEKIRLAVKNCGGSSSAEKDPISWILARFPSRDAGGKERGNRSLERI